MDGTTVLLKRVCELLDREPETVAELKVWCQQVLCVLLKLGNDAYVGALRAVGRKAHGLASLFGATEAAKSLQAPEGGSIAKLVDCWELNYRLTCLIEWCDAKATPHMETSRSRPETSTATPPSPQLGSDHTAGSKRKGKQINERMLAKLQSDPHSCLGWSVRKWAQHLECSISSVQESPAWTTIIDARKLSEAQSVTRRKDGTPADRRKLGKKRSESA
jgi:hypothetical protein